MLIACVVFAPVQGNAGSVLYNSMYILLESKYYTVTHGGKFYYIIDLACNQLRFICFYNHYKYLYSYLYKC